MPYETHLHQRSGNQILMPSADLNANFFSSKYLSIGCIVKIGSSVSSPVKKLWQDHFIPHHSNLIAHPMDKGIIKDSLDTCNSIKSVRVDSLPYWFTVHKSFMSGDWSFNTMWTCCRKFFANQQTHSVI